MGTNSDKTILIEILSSFFADIGNVGSKLFKTSFCITHLKGVLINVDRGKNILFNQLFIDYDSILKVVTLPGHERNLEVATQCKFTISRTFTFSQGGPLLHSLTFRNESSEL